MLGPIGAKFEFGIHVQESSFKFEELLFCLGELYGCLWASMPLAQTRCMTQYTRRFCFPFI